MQEQNNMYSLIKLEKSQNDICINPIKDLTKDESDLIVKELNALCDYHKISNKQRLIHSAIIEFEKNISTNNNIKIERSIIEVLSLFYMYLETIGVVINKDFGKNSNEMDRFKSSKSLEFDSYFSYRFLSKLRNYIIHYEFPNFYITKSESEDTRVSVDVECLNLDKSIWGKPISKDFESGDCKIELITMFRELMHCINRISNTCINFYDIAKIKTRCEFILKYKKHLNNANEDLAICKIILKDGKPKTFSNMNIFPFGDFEHFLKRVRRSVAKTTATPK